MCTELIDSYMRLVSQDIAVHKDASVPVIASFIMTPCYFCTVLTYYTKHLFVAGN
jgi:hypothetical protein